MPRRMHETSAFSAGTDATQALSSNALDLPPGWALARLGGVVRLSQETVEPSEAPDARLVGLEHIESHTREILGSAKASEVKSTKNVFRGGDILYGKLRPYLNKVALPDFSGVCSTDVLVMRSESGVESEFLARILGSPAFVDFAMSRSSGLNLPRVTFPKLEDFAFGLPPLAEQRRILHRLKALESRLRLIRSTMTEIPNLLVRSRQSFLTSALRGELTSEWREREMGVEQVVSPVAQGELRLGRNGRAFEQNVIPGVAALSVGDPNTPVPENWMRLALLKVAKLESGHTPSRQHPEYWGGGVNWVSIPDARDGNGKILNQTASTITESGLANSAARVLPAGTVCLSRTASIGYVVIMGKPMATSQDFANWICTPALLPEFLMYAFLAEGNNLIRFGKGTTHTTIYYSELEEIHITLPPLLEQGEIVRRLEITMARLDSVREAHSKILNELDGLDQIVLERALQGKLTAQDPNDESATQLLERILHERETRSPLPKRKRSRTTMRKLTSDSVMSAIQKIPKDRLSFEEIRSVVVGSYEEIKGALFEILSKSDPPLRQVFDVELRAMLFEKTKL